MSLCNLTCGWLLLLVVLIFPRQSSVVCDNQRVCMRCLISLCLHFESGSILYACTRIPKGILYGLFELSPIRTFISLHKAISVT